MLTIRPVQFAVFSQWEVRKFEDWMLAHLKKFFPQECAASDEGLRDLTQYGIRRAAGYGITARRDVCKYIDLMVVFGRDFDADKGSRWAAEILRKRGTSSARMRTLLAEAKIRLRNH